MPSLQITLRAKYFSTENQAFNDSWSRDFHQDKKFRQKNTMAWTFRNESNLVMEWESSSILVTYIIYDSKTSIYNITCYNLLAKPKTSFMSFHTQLLIAFLKFDLETLLNKKGKEVLRNSLSYLFSHQHFFIWQKQLVKCSSFFVRIK